MFHHCHDANCSGKGVLDNAARAAHHTHMAVKKEVHSCCWVRTCHHNHLMSS